MAMEANSAGQQPLEEAILDYRSKHPGPTPDFDAQFVLDMLSKINDSSNILIAIDPVIAGLWNKEARTFGITGVFVSDDIKLVFKVHRNKKTLTADELRERIWKVMKHLSSKHIPVAFEYNENVYALTDMFGHSFVKEMWAGLPFDVVLAQITPDANKPAGAKPAGE